MMRICMVVHQYYHRDGRVRRYAESLADAGASVDVLNLRDKEWSAESYRDDIGVYDIPLSRGYKKRGNYLFEYAIALVLFTIRLFFLQLRRRYHVIHVHNMPDFLIFSALLPKLLGAKLILDVHDPMPEFYMSKYESTGENTVVKLMRAQEQLSAKLATAVITANINFKHNLIDRGTPTEKITVINNVADTKIFDRERFPHQPIRERAAEGSNGNGHAADEFRLIYPGTIAPRYGLAIAIRALPQLTQQIPNLHLRVVGAKVDHVQELEALSEELGVADVVEFKGLIPVHEVPKEMSQADIGIYPALPDPHMDIATPTKVLEYATMGVPIVSSRLKIVEDLFDESSIQFFEPGNVDQFAEAVLTLYNNPEQQQRLVQNADRVFVEKHSWENEKGAYFGLLNRIVTRRKVAKLQSGQGV